MVNVTAPIVKLEPVVGKLAKVPETWPDGAVRIVKLSFSAEGTEPFSLAGANREATHYVAKVEIGGVAGVVAPLVGKQPPDQHIWIVGGEAPTLVKSETLSYMGGPVWRTEILSPAWPKSARTQAKEAAPKP